MLKIGDFSKLAHVTVKTLRHYAELGLLSPIWTDRFSGYRYYTLEQLPRLNRILALKDLGFSLEQIRAMLDANLPPEVLRQMFNQKQDELQTHVVEEQSRLRRVAARLQQIEREGTLTGFDVTVKPIPVYWIVSERANLEFSIEIAEETYAIRQKLASRAMQAGLRSAGAWLVLQNASQYKEKGMEAEVGLLLAEPVPQGRDYPDVHIRRLPAVTRMASLLQLHDEQPTPDAYTSLYRWIDRNGYLVTGVLRQLFFDQEDEKATYSELQVPVESALERQKKYFSNPYRKENDMEPKIITRPAFTIVGMRYFGNNQNQEISQLWGTANQHLNKVKNVDPEWGAIGLCTTVADAPPGEFEYVAGLVVNKVEDLPQGFVVRDVPSLQYAVFTHVGGLGDLKDTYDYIYHTWLPRSGYELAGNIDFEYYDEDFKDFAPDSRFYIYVPIK